MSWTPQNRDVSFFAYGTVVIVETTYEWAVDSSLDCCFTAEGTPTSTPPSEEQPQAVSPLAAANTLLRRVLAGMEKKSVGNYCFQPGCVEPGVDNC